MRFFIVTFLKKENGRIDEQVGVTKRLKTNDLQTASIILDFAERKIVKSTIDGVKQDLDFDRLLEYYRKHYGELLDQLERINQAAPGAA